MASPIILTLQLDAASQAFFEDERRRWFPPKLNKIPAHLTMFHQLPGEEREAVVEAVARACAARTPFPVRAEEIMGMGGGFAYRVRSDALTALRGELAARFSDWLTAQDRQGFRPHVTAQNKVTGDTAKACRAVAEAAFEPFEATAEGVQLWSYEGGPWGTLGAIGFGAD